MESDDLPTSISVPRRILADLRLIKAEMAKAEGRTVYLPEVITRLIACWREQQQKEGRRV